MPAQLRIYHIRPGRMEEFVEEFHQKIAPVRAQYDFDVLGPWIVDDERQFVWIAVYEGALSWPEAVDRYYDSPERSSIDFDPSDYIDSMDVRMLRSV